MDVALARTGRTRTGARRTAWFGVLGVSAGSAYLGVVGLVELCRAHDLAAALNAARGRSIGPALVVVVGLLVVAERAWPAVRRPLLARAHLIDGCYLLVFALVVIPLLTLVETGFALEIDRHAAFLVLGRLPVVPRLVVVLATLVGIDAMNWCAHVANHRFRTLWRLHALHHSQEDMSVLTTFRTHPLVHATYLPALLPALVLGASGSVPTAALIAYGCLVTLPHANLRWSLGPLGRIVISPAYHRIHHARELGARGTVNYGFVLTCWDRLARTAIFPSAGAPIETGIAGRPVPVEQQDTTAHLRVTLLAQLSQPFRRLAATDGWQ